MMSASASRSPVSVKSRVGPALLREPVELVAEHVQLAVQEVAQDLLLGGEDDLFELGLPVDEAVIGRVQRALGGGIDEQAVDQVHELVAGGAGDRQVLAQILVAGEDLLDQQVDRPAGAGVDRRGVRRRGSRRARRRRATAAAGSSRAGRTCRRCGRGARPATLPSAIRRSSRRWVASNTSPRSMRRPASWLMSKKRR